MAYKKRGYRGSRSRRSKGKSKVKRTYYVSRGGIRL